MKYLLLLSTFSFMFSCAVKEEESFESSGSGACYINNSMTPMACLKYNDNSNAPDTHCTDIYKPHFVVNHGANGHAWYSSLITEGQACDTTNQVGTCSMSNGSATYYTPDFNATTAQADCENIWSGTWAP